MNQRKIILRYFVEMFLAFLLYAIVLTLSTKFGLHMHKGLLRTLILFSPALPFLLSLGVIARQFRRVDEYVRKVTLENIMVAAAVTSAWTFSYGFLEDAGFPRLSMFLVMPVLFGTWFILSMVRLGRR